jgi:hypothetical protein
MFEQLQLPRDCGLRNAQAFRGPAEAAFFKNDQEQSEFVEHDKRVMRKSHHGNRQ